MLIIRGRYCNTMERVSFDGMPLDLIVLFENIINCDIFKKTRSDWWFKFSFGWKF